MNFIFYGCFLKKLTFNVFSNTAHFDNETKCSNLYEFTWLNWKRIKMYYEQHWHKKFCEIASFKGAHTVGRAQAYTAERIFIYSETYNSEPFCCIINCVTFKGKCFLNTHNPTRPRNHFSYTSDDFVEKLAISWEKHDKIDVCRHPYRGSLLKQVLYEPHSHRGS